MANQFLRTTAQIVSWMIFAIIFIIVYAAYKERVAEQKAREFCSSVTIGESSNKLFDRAVSSGADHEKTHWSNISINTRMLAVVFIGFTPMSRHICRISASDKVISVDYTYID
jgi:hypothetical protein